MTCLRKQYRKLRFGIVIWLIVIGAAPAIGKTLRETSLRHLNITLEVYKTGETHYWVHQETGVRGEVTPVQTYIKTSPCPQCRPPCRSYRRKMILDEKSRTWAGVACRGVTPPFWKVVEEETIDQQN